MSWVPQATEPYAPLSVNKADFQFKYLAKEQAFKPKDEIGRVEGKFEGEASSRSDYKAWDTPARYQRQKAQYQKPEGEMQLRSSYASEFVNGNAYVKLPPIRPQQQMEEQKPFEGKSESSDSFPHYRRMQASQARQLSFRPHQEWQAPSEPFSNNSSYNGDFMSGGKAAKAQPVRYEDQLQLSKDPMETCTTSQGAYLPAKAAERRRPIVPKGELQLPTEAMIAQSTQRGDFSPRYQPKQQPIRHSNQLELSREPFLAKTVMQEEFVPRQAQRATPVRPSGELQLSRDPMEATTTTRAIYTPKKRDGDPPRRRPLADPQRLPANQIVVG